MLPCVLALWGAGLGAQPDPDPDPDPEPVASIFLPEEPEAPAAEPVPLEDVVVTATKRDALRRDVPASIAAFTGAELEWHGDFELRDFLRRVPGVAQTIVQADQSRISVRGIQIDAGGNTPEATGVFIDEIPFNDPFLNQVRPDLPPFDLAGVEVLKGPQGTLFGGSALAGAVRYKIADAIPGATSLSSFGAHQTVSEGAPALLAGASANVPMGDAAAVRLVGVRRHAGGVVDDRRSGARDTDSSETFSGRAVLRWNLSPMLSARLLGLHQHTDVNDVPYAETTDGRLERERALRSASPGVSRFDVYGLELSGPSTWGTWTSATSAVNKYANWSGRYAERVLGIEDAGQPADAPVMADVEGLVQELRLVSTDDPDSTWTWLAGVYGHEYASLTTQRLTTRDALTGQEIEALNFLADIEASERAAFGEASLRLGRRWTVTAGARAYVMETAGTVVSTGAIILVTGSPENRNDASIRASGVNPKLALQLEVSESVAAYLTTARGFRFGGVQIVGPSPASPDVPPTYAPDSVWNYELGVRTEWLENTLELDGAVFYIDWEDPQVPSTTGGAVPLNIIDNLDGARSAGAELGLRYAIPLPGLLLELGAAYTDAETTAPYRAPNGTTVPAGTRLPCYAELQGAAALRYRAILGPVALDGLLGYSRQGRGVSDILQSLDIYDYETVDARVALTRPAWAGARLTLGVANLTDERAVVSALVQGPDNFTTVYNRPRTIELRLDLSF